MAMSVMAVVGVAPCQCFLPGGNQTASPGQISSIAPPSFWTPSQPAVTMRVCPSGCVCRAMRAWLESYTDPLNKCRVGCLEKRIDPDRGPLTEGCVATAQEKSPWCGCCTASLPGIALRREPARRVWSRHRPRSRGRPYGRPQRTH